MKVSDAQRLLMNDGLRSHMGDKLSDLVMAHLPPGGYEEMAQKSDIMMLKSDIVMLRSEMSSLEKNMMTIERRLNLVITVGIAIGLALIGLQTQIMLSVARL